MAIFALGRYYVVIVHLLTGRHSTLRRLEILQGWSDASRTTLNIYFLIKQEYILSKLRWPSFKIIIRIDLGHISYVIWIYPTFGNIQVEEIHVENGLYASRNDGDFVDETFVSVTVVPVNDIKSSERRND